jgi:hypothetical protein
MILRSSLLISLFVPLSSISLSLLSLAKTAMLSLLLLCSRTYAVCYDHTRLEIPVIGLSPSRYLLHMLWTIQQYGDGKVAITYLIATWFLPLLAALEPRKGEEHS